PQMRLLLHIHAYLRVHPTRRDVLWPHYRDKAFESQLAEGVIAASQSSLRSDAAILIGGMDVPSEFNLSDPIDHLHGRAAVTNERSGVLHVDGPKPKAL